MVVSGIHFAERARLLRVRLLFFEIHLVMNRFAMMNFDARIGAHPSDFCSGKSHQNHSLRRTTLRVPSRTRSNRRGRKLAALRHTASCFLIALRRSVARKSQLSHYQTLFVGARTAGEWLSVKDSSPRGLGSYYEV